MLALTSHPMDFSSSAKTQGITATLTDKNDTKMMTSINLLIVKRLISRLASTWFSSNIGFNCSH
jgi:hypothetical protein